MLLTHWFIIDELVSNQLIYDFHCYLISLADNRGPIIIQCVTRKLNTILILIVVYLFLFPKLIIAYLKTTILFTLPIRPLIQLSVLNLNQLLSVLNGKLNKLYAHLPLNNDKLVYTFKFLILVSVLVFIRGGIPRYRYDFLTKLG